MQIMVNACKFLLDFASNLFYYTIVLDDMVMRFGIPISIMEINYYNLFKGLYFTETCGIVA